jgi:hypothetical protein
MNEMIIVSLVLLGIVLVIGLLLVFILIKRKNEGSPVEPNYRALFIIGISFLPLGSLGIILDNPGFMGMTALGVIYMSIGLAHRDKWEKNNKKK